MRIILHSMLWLLVTSNVPSSLIPTTLMMEVICSSEMSVHMKATQCNIPEGGIFYVTFVKVLFLGYTATNLKLHTLIKRKYCLATDFLHSIYHGLPF
jgi:hypothetical protein